MARASRTARPSFIQVLGELLITIGIILILYVVWQLFVNDPLVSSTQQKQAQQFVADKEPSSKKFIEIKPNLKQGAVFAKMHVPKFGNEYERLIGQGTFQKVTLNIVGVGHYISSQWPGEVGNFAVAAHRTSHGAPFSNIDRLSSGDRVWVETNDNWFTYEYRQTKIVRPSEIGVIQNVPKGLAGAVSGGKYMTMTSCHPKWSNEQRIIVWLELVNSEPKGSGMPAELLEAKRR
jgi:sortase A